MIKRSVELDLSVYFIADPHVCGGREIVDVVRAAVKGGATLVQLRDKESEPNDFLQTASAVQDVLRPLGVPLIINDHIEVARQIQADGVHLGQQDLEAMNMDPRDVRKEIGEQAILGVTAYESEHFLSLDRNTVDYAGTGPFYKTKTDKGKPVLGEKKFRLLRVLSTVPVVAIGGITPARVEKVMKAGADGVAVMSAIGEAEDPEESACAFVKAVQKAKKSKAA